jgi:hypothetical protein
MTHTELLAHAAAKHAHTMRNAGIQPQDACPDCGGDLWHCTCPIPVVDLYYCAALPAHVIACTTMGRLYLMPIIISDQYWHQAVPYRGNYTVEPMPAYVRAMYGHPLASTLS